MATTLRAVPETFMEPIEIVDRINSTDEEVKTIVKLHRVYVKGDGTPVPIVIETDRVFAEYDDNYPDEDELAAISSITQRIAKTRRANLLMHRDLLMEVVAGLDIEDADVLAGTDAGEDLLIRAKWLSARVPEDAEPAPEEAEDDTKGEVTTVTGDSIFQMPTQDIQESTS